MPKIEDTQMVYNENAYIKSKDEINQKASALTLSFEPQDIKYIIIKHDSEITEFINVLRSAKGKFSYNEVDRLTTRIITTEQILSDF
ncbi:hypothetical protein LX99_00811 [Mucilaginibacter oryzae]|uniref:Uncharacterized protein n=1 Tax=Mucilaginibacter oryzae TaxID=468058 RepID=A0A316HIJ8_9SPHI|nr:hypothetical protein [Mucilaginibacter oryzae]PWK80346.1 hypothetical protein LX99_00811 [Mucilaginibacter oryzae]